MDGFLRCVLHGTLDDVGAGMKATGGSCRRLDPYGPAGGVSGRRTSHAATDRNPDNR